jgi:hypothetical protein
VAVGVRVGVEPLVVAVAVAVAVGGGGLPPHAPSFAHQLSVLGS